MVANPYRMWSDIDRSLPAVEIEVLGPPPTSGTRDAFVELAMEGGCKTFPAIKAMKDEDKGAYKAVCHSIREDGAWIDAGENDNLIVQKLEANPSAFGVFGFSFLDQNSDKIQGSTVDGVEPTFENISAQDYPVSRSLYFYVKNAHVNSIPGMHEYISEFTSEKAWGPEGYLSDKGLIPLPDDERKAIRESSMDDSFNVFGEITACGANRKMGPGSLYVAWATSELSDSTVGAGGGGKTTAPPLILARD